MKQFVGYLLRKAAGKGKVSPTIKSVKPTTKLQDSVQRTKIGQTVKNVDRVNKLKKQKEQGIRSARAASRELQRGAETKKFTKIGKNFYARQVPADATDLRNPTVAKTKKFKTGKQLEAEKKARENKMGGGMMGRRFGMRSGTNPFKKETNVDKIKKTFAPKKGLKKIDPKKQKGLAKLKQARPDVVRKMGYMKKGGRAGFKGGGAGVTGGEKIKFQLDKNLKNLKDKMKGPTFTKEQIDTLKRKKQ